MLYLLYQTPKFLTIHYAIINQRKCLDFWILTTRNCSFDFLLFNIYCSYVLMFSCWGSRKRRKEQCCLICCPREKRNNLMMLFLHMSDRTSRTFIHYNCAKHDLSMSLSSQIQMQHWTGPIRLLILFVLLRVFIEVCEYIYLNWVISRNAKCASLQRS